MEKASLLTQIAEPTSGCRSGLSAARVERETEWNRLPTAWRGRQLPQRTIDECRHLLSALALPLGVALVAERRWRNVSFASLCHSSLLVFVSEAHGTCCVGNGLNPFAAWVSARSVRFPGAWNVRRPTEVPSTTFIP